VKNVVTAILRGDIVDFFVSDLHICNGQPGVDDFRPHVGAFIKFIREVVKLPENSLYVVGDYLEMGQAHLEDILYNYMTIWEMLKTVKVIPGNHDEALTNIAAALAWEVLPIEYIKEYGNKRFYITHGHLWDPFNKPGSTVGSIATGLWAYAERAGISEGPFNTLLDLISSPSTKGVVKAAKAKDCEYVIMGHDHIPKIKKMDGVSIYDCGTWTHRWSGQGYSYVVVDDGGNISLKWFMA